MSNDVFYTKFEIPDDMTQARIREVMSFLVNNRSVAEHRLEIDQGIILILIANRYDGIKYSDCPLPGTHDFAAGWLALEAMLSISRYFDAPIEWTEAEYKKEHGQVVNTIIRDKPKIVVHWRDFLGWEH